MTAQILDFQAFKARVEIKEKEIREMQIDREGLEAVFVHILEHNLDTGAIK